MEYSLISIQDIKGLIIIIIIIIIMMVIILNNIYEMFLAVLPRILFSMVTLPLGSGHRNKRWWQAGG